MQCDLAGTLQQAGSNLSQKIKDLLKLGDKEIKLSDQYPNVILVLGNTGVGKTPFVRWMTEDNTKLMSVKD